MANVYYENHELQKPSWPSQKHRSCIPLVILEGKEKGQWWQPMGPSRMNRAGENYGGANGDNPFIKQWRNDLFCWATAQFTIRLVQTLPLAYFQETSLIQSTIQNCIKSGRHNDHEWHSSLSYHSSEQKVQKVGPKGLGKIQINKKKNS